MFIETKCAVTAAVGLEGNGSSDVRPLAASKQARAFAPKLSGLPAQQAGGGYDKLRVFHF